MKRHYTEEEINAAALEWLDNDPEKYELWLEHKDEYLEFRREVKRMCEEDKALVEGVVMELQSILDEMHELTKKPGWETLCYEIELRNFRSQFLDGTYVANPTCVQHYPPMGDKEMAKATGLSRERIVQETKRCSRKLGQKLQQRGINSVDFAVSQNDSWEEN